MSANGHPYGEGRDYYCPNCDYRTTRYWTPPYAHCPECGDAALRRDPFRYDQG